MNSYICWLNKLNPQFLGKMIVTHSVCDTLFREHGIILPVPIIGVGQ